MFRAYAVNVNKVGCLLKVSKQSQRMCFSSFPNNKDNKWSVSQFNELSALKAKQETILAGLKEKYDSLSNELQFKYSQEKQEVLKKFQFPQLRNVTENNKDSISKESVPAAASISLFKNVDELNSFCDKIYNQCIRIDRNVAKKVVEVMTTHCNDSDRIRNILFGLCNVPAKEYIQRDLSEAGFGNALSVVLAANTNNYSLVVEVSNWFLRDFYYIDEDYKCAQDLYDAIDSPDGYNDTIFDTLLHIMSHENKLRVKGCTIAEYLLHNTKFAKERMIEKGFIEILKSVNESDQTENMNYLLAMLSDECDENSGTIPEECLPAIPSGLFNNDDEINEFCQRIRHSDKKKFEISYLDANKIVELLSSQCDNQSDNTAERIDMILTGIKCESPTTYRKSNTDNLYAAGFGKALSVVLSNHANNRSILAEIRDLFWYDHQHKICFGSRAQDLYNAIDSAFIAYEGNIFESLLTILNNKDRKIVITGVKIAYYLTRNTRHAKKYMIEKGFAEVIEALDISKSECEDIDDLKRTLKKQ